MTRKDYILIAEALRVQYHNAKIVHAAAISIEATPAEASDGQFESGVIVGIDHAASEIADSLARDNAAFKKDHFMAVVRGEKALNSRPGSR